MGKRYGVGLSEKKSATLSVTSGLLPAAMVPGISGQEVSWPSPPEGHVESVLGRDDTEPQG